VMNVVFDGGENMSMYEYVPQGMISLYLFE
jgi:hypothetical protein